jgi:hypothetical protein
LGSREEKLGEMHLFRGSLHSCIWELFFAWILVLFCRWCRALLPHLEESAILEHFISVALSRCPCHRGPRFFSLEWSFHGPRGERDLDLVSGCWWLEYVGWRWALLFLDSRSKETKGLVPLAKREGLGNGVDDLYPWESREGLARKSRSW